MSKKPTNTLDSFRIVDRFALNRQMLLKKTTRSSDTIWQHMRVEYFESLLDKSKLCFKPISSYNYELERNPLTYVYNISEMFSSEPLRLQVAFDKLNTNSYLSCWYRNAHIVTGIYNRFTSSANGKHDPRGGVAIRVSVSKLSKYLNSISLPNYNLIFNLGLVYYIPLASIEKHVIPNFKRELKKNHSISSYIPYYFKKTNYGDENEFRIMLQVLEVSNPGKKVVIDKNPNQDPYFLPIDIAELIEGFAIPYSYYPIDAINSNVLTLLDAKGLTAIEEDLNMDGYVFYRIERKK